MRLQQKRNHAKYFRLVFWKVAKERSIIKPFSKVTGILSTIHVSKKFPLYFFMCIIKKVVLLEISRNSLLTVYGLKHKLPNKFLKAVSKLFGRGPGRALYLSSFSVNYRPTNYNLQRCKLLNFWKFPEIASTVEFLFPEASTKKFSERPASVPKKDSIMSVLLWSFLTFLK